MTFEESVEAYRRGELFGLELRQAALVGLTLRNVHARMGVREVRESLGVFSRWRRVGFREGPRTRPGYRAALVLRTWSRAPPGGWLRAHAAWQRLLQLEAMADGAPADDLDGDRDDLEPAIRAWAVVARDAHGDTRGLMLDLDDPEPEVRLLAAAALVERGLADEMVRRVLRELLDMERCSADAVAVLEPLRDASAAPKLLEMYATTRRDDVLKALAFVEALPILEHELIENASWEALQAIRGLGPEAEPLLQPILTKLTTYAVAPLRVVQDVTGLEWLDDAHDQRSQRLFEALAALGDAAQPAVPTLLAWASRRERASGTFTFEVAAAVAAGAVSHEARTELGRWLDDPELRGRALHGLAAGGRASWPWRDAVARHLDDPDDQTAIDAAVALASLGDTRGARDAWLSFEAWPLTHHGTNLSLYRLADLLIRDLPDCVDPADMEDVVLTVKALQTAGLRDRGAWSVLALIAGEEARARAAAEQALERLERLLENP